MDHHPHLRSRKSCQEWNFDDPKIQQGVIRLMKDLEALDNPMCLNDVLKLAYQGSKQDLSFTYPFPGESPALSRPNYSHSVSGSTRVRKKGFRSAA